MPSTDTYIEKDASINDEIDKLRHSATSSLFERRDVIIVASVSCIYGLGNPKEYKDLMLSLRPGMIRDRDEVLRKLWISNMSAMMQTSSGAPSASGAMFGNNTCQQL